MKKARFSAVSSTHLGQPEKPNEDAFYVTGSSNGSRATVLAVADGVTMHSNGSYPAHSDFAAIIFASMVGAFVQNLQYEDDPVGMFRELFRMVNKTIGVFNLTYPILNHWNPLERVSTTGLVVFVPERSCTAFVGWIGDSVGMQFGKSDSQVFTRNQLANLDQHRADLAKRFVKENGGDLEKANREFVKWRHAYLRNNPEARVDGVDMGYGVLDGDERALEFLEIKPIVFSPGDRFILATDAIRAIPSPDSVRAHIADLSDYFKRTDLDQLPQDLVNMIRDAEEQKHVRSDDATIVALQI